MDMMDRLLEHDRWATTRLLEASRGLTDAQLDQAFDIGHRSLRATFDHQIANVAGWTAMMVGRPPEDDGATDGIDVFIRRHDATYDAFAAFARRARDDGRLDETFTNRFFDSEHTVGGTILHVALHDEWHRSEVAHILQRLGVDVPEVDQALWDCSVRAG